MTTQLTPAQHALLASAVAATGGAPADGFARGTAASLIKRGYLISIPNAEGSSWLMATTTGQAAMAAVMGDEDVAAHPNPPESVPETPAATEEPEAPPPAPGMTPAPKAPAGKIGILIDLLRRPDGAAIDDMMAATGWQAHSVRGAISGSIKKRLGLTVISEKADGGARIYRIAGDHPAEIRFNEAG